MKFVILFITFFGISAQAADNCSLGLAKKFADGIIAVEVKENNYRPGRLIFKRGESREYTREWLKENIDLCGQGSACGDKYSALLKEIEVQPDLHIYRTKYQWHADDGNHLGFYYVVRLKNYGHGCALKSLAQE